MSSSLRDFHGFISLGTEQRRLAASAAAAETPKLTVVKVCRVQHVLICCPNARGSDWRFRKHGERVEADKKTKQKHKIIRIERQTRRVPFECAVASDALTVTK